MKFLGNGVVFAVVYILAMIPTYLLPYLGSNSTVIGSVSAAAQEGLPIQTMGHLIALAILITITWFRGTLVGKQWLVIMPIIAGIFDMAPGLSVIPFVPTVMHVFALIKGVSENSIKAVVKPEAS